MAAMRFRTPTYTVGSFNLCHNIFKDGTSIRCKNSMHMTPGKRSAKYKQKTRHINVYKISVFLKKNKKNSSLSISVAQGLSCCLKLGLFSNRYFQL